MESWQNELVEKGGELVSIGWGCPFESVVKTVRSSMGSEMLGYINYFLPISEFLTVLTFWVVAIGIYYIASIFMRWVKAIS